MAGSADHQVVEAVGVQVSGTVQRISGELVSL
jgi:hypothetical protein